MAATGGNTGNVAFVYAARKILGNHIARISWGMSPDEVRGNCDHLVICCANQIGKHADLGGWADRLESFGLPVTLLGLGAQSESPAVMPEIPEGTRRFLKVVEGLKFEGASNVAVRGAFTQTVLQKEGTEAIPTGCPSLHISPVRRLGQAVLKRQSEYTTPAAVAVAAGNPWHQRSAFLERTLVEIVNNKDGAYVLQHPESMLQFAVGEREGIKETTLARFLEVYGPTFDEASLLDWYRRKACFYVDAPNWMRALNRFDLVLGPRYHGVALAIQAGIPGTVITIDSRTEELCTGTGMKAIAINDAIELGAEELCEKAKWTEGDAEEFDNNRLVKGKRIIDFLNANGLRPSEHLTALAQ